MLRILECYVLWAIGELSNDEVESLRKVEPKLRQVFGKEGDWREIVTQVMDLPENIAELIKANWAKNQDLARQRHITLTGQQFAEMFVDENLVS